MGRGVLMPMPATAVGVGTSGGGQQGRSGQGEKQETLHQVSGVWGRVGGVAIGCLTLLAFGSTYQFWDMFLGG